MVEWVDELVWDSQTMAYWRTFCFVLALYTTRFVSHFLLSYLFIYYHFFWVGRGFEEEFQSQAMENRR